MDTVEKVASITARIIVFLMVFIIFTATKVHYRDHYYKYTTETCWVRISEKGCIITRPNGHKYEYDSALLKEQETFHIFTFCDNGTPKDFTDDYIVIK